LKKLSDTKDYYLIESKEDIDFCLNILKDSEFVAFDTETTGLNVRKDRVIGLSFSTKVNQGYYYPIYYFDKSTSSILKLEDLGLYTILNTLKSKKLIMHNGAYDTKIVMNNLKTDLLSAFYADTQLMRHTLKEDGPFALKDIAVELADKIGISQDEVANQEQLELELNVKANGGSWKKSNKEMFKADLEVLAKYAAADTDLTLRLFYYFQKELDSQSLRNFFYKDEVMPVYTHATIPMEFEGVHIDMPKITKYNHEIIEDIKALYDSINYKIQNSKSGKQFVQQRAEKEYPVKNTGSFAQAVAEHYKLDLPKSINNKYSLTAKNISKLPDSAAKQFLLGEITNLSDESEIQMLLLQKDGELINIGSKQQLATLVFDIMGIQPLSETAKGSPQFNEDVIENLASEHKIDWAQDLRVYNKLNKIKSSYYDRFLEQQEDGIFYPSFKQHGTTSGRFGSDIQQLSRPLEEGSDDARVVKYTNTLRELIIPKPGYVFIDDDYESLEPRVFADDAGDKALIEIFELGEDFYSKVAIQTEGLTGVSAHKKDPTFLKNSHPEVRQNAKAYSLGIRYGMKAPKLAGALNITKEEAQEKIDNYFKSFPNLKKAMDGYLESAKKTGIVKSKYGRVRHLPRAKAIYDKYGDDILEYSKLRGLSKKFFKSYDDLQVIRKEYNNLLNNALNFPIQAAATSVVNRAMLDMSLKFKEQNLDAWVSLQIHDQIVVSCAEDSIDKVKKIVQDSMENTNKLAMKLIAKPEVAHNLREGHT
jgi:DNA polymerase I-like protein with 3'-5' exonuclease and polymerase domains